MSEQGPERRGGVRVGFQATVTIVRTRPDETAEFTLRDLSSSGARIIGRLRLVEGERITVQLVLEDVELSLTATVVRTEPQSAQAAIAFSDLSAEAREVIDRAVTAMIEGVRASSPSTILVVCVPPDTGAALERDLAQLGRASRVCATMLETMWALTGPTVNCEAVIVASHLAPKELADLLEHLAEHHRHLRRLVLFGDKVVSIDHAASSRVDAVLRTPLRIRALARALGIRATDSSIAMLPTNESDP